MVDRGVLAPFFFFFFYNQFQLHITTMNNHVQFKYLRKFIMKLFIKDSFGTKVELTRDLEDQEDVGVILNGLK